ncbi:alpha/beta fold hydrolase [Rahnella sp. CFA14(1/10)]|uniref:alpha/beta fold hydrolase n=1 Tax=Rahnella sp. CFA14(1/10) TaxID=2511203 RepID=UPI001020CDC2|nr:alpha/beta hydrolase [Rahnella sp. CFA14(1/10)]
MNNSSNTPVIFINGLIGTLNDPKFHRPLGDRPVIAPDLNGYGARSDIPVEKINIWGQVKRIYEVIQAEYQGSAVSLVGHSVGGAVAYTFAHKYPECVKEIVSVEGNFSLKDAFWTSTIAKMTLMQVESMLADMQCSPETWLEGSGIDPQSDKIQIATIWLKHQPASTLLAMARSVVEVTGDPGYQTLVKTVFTSVPVHLLAGEHSASGWDVPDWATQHAKSVTVMPSTGHLMMLQDPTTFGQRVAEILS